MVYDEQNGQSGELIMSKDSERMLTILHSKPEDVLQRFRDGSARLCVIGLGRIGLPTATIFASKGIKVIGVDINPVVVENVNQGTCRFIDEPGLDKLLD